MQNTTSVFPCEIGVSPFLWTADFRSSLRGSQTVAALGRPTHMNVATVKLGCTRLAVPPNPTNPRRGSNGHLFGVPWGR